MRAHCLFARRPAPPVEDEEPITASFLGKTTLRDQRYVIEEMALIDALNRAERRQDLRRGVPEGVWRAGLRRVHGRAGGGAGERNTDRSDQQLGRARFSARIEAADWFGAGTLQFTSGANTGLRPLEIKAYAADGTIRTHEAFHYAPAIGDSSC